MSSILNTISAMITPEMLARLGKQFGLSDELTRRGLAITSAVLAGGLARAAATPDGAASVLQLIDTADTGVMSNLSSLLTDKNVARDDIAAQIFGKNLPVIMDGVKRATGIDITPFVGICAPVVLALAKNLVAQQQLDADGLAKLIQTDVKGLGRRDSATAQALKEVFRPLEAQDKLRASFSGEEWAALRQGPVNAAALIMLADHSGGGGRRQEIEALLQTVAKAAAIAGPADLLSLLFSEEISSAEVEALVKAYRKTEAQELRAALLGPVTAAVTTAKKAGGANATAYQGLLIDVAQQVAAAAKEGGVLGIGGTLISIEEKLAIDELAAAVAAG